MVGTGTRGAPSVEPVRLRIQQPSLAAYRVPVYRELARTPGLILDLLHGSEEPLLDNAPADGFDASLVPFRRLDDRVACAVLGRRLGTRVAAKIGGLYWHRAHLAALSGADVAILSWNTRFLSLWVALAKARLTGTPVAIWGHGYSKSSNAAWRSWLRRLPIRLASLAILYDAHTLERLVGEGVPRERLAVAPNGLDGAAIACAKDRIAALSSTERQEWRERNGVAEAPNLLHVGRVFPESRLDVVVDALPRLASTFPRIKLVIVGRGDAELASLRARAAALGVDERLVTPGPVYDEALVARWMDACDAMVYPTNAGLSLIHAFNYGLPVVLAGPLSAHNPERAAFDEGINGALAATLDPADVAAAIERVLGDPDRHRALSEGALNVVRRTHNVDAMVDAFRTTAFSLARSRRGRRGTVFDH